MAGLSSGGLLLEAGAKKTPNSGSQSNPLIIHLRLCQQTQEEMVEPAKQDKAAPSLCGCHVQQENPSLSLSL